MPPNWNFCLTSTSTSGQRREIGRHDLEQPLIAGMAFHADTQCAAFALRKLYEALFRVQAVVAARRLATASRYSPACVGAQAAALAQPDGRTELLLQLRHRWLKRGLRQTQHFRGGGQRAVLVDRAGRSQDGCVQACMTYMSVKLIDG